MESEASSEAAAPANAGQFGPAAITAAELETWIEALEDDRLYSASEIASLGICHVSYFHELIKEGVLPAVQVGRRQSRRVLGRSLKTWLRSRVVIPEPRPRRNVRGGRPARDEPEPELSPEQKARVDAITAIKEGAT